MNILIACILGLTVLALMVSLKFCHALKNYGYYG